MAEGENTPSSGEQRLQRIENDISELRKHVQKMSDSIAQLASLHTDIKHLRDQVGSNSERIGKLEDKAHEIDKAQARQGVRITVGRAVGYAILLAVTSGVAGHLIE